MIESKDGEASRVRLPGGALVMARSAEDIPAGSKVTVVVRPERVLILPGNEPQMNSLDVTVQEIIYSGDHVKFRMALADQSIVIAKLLTNSRSFTDSEVGNRLTIGWKVEDCFAFVMK